MLALNLSNVINGNVELPTTFTAQASVYEMIHSPINSGNILLEVLELFLRTKKKTRLLQRSE